jgi:hypothetical protein
VSHFIFYFSIEKAIFNLKILIMVSNLETQF